MTLSYESQAYIALLTAHTLTEDAVILMLHLEAHFCRSSRFMLRPSLSFALSPASAFPC